MNNVVIDIYKSVLSRYSKEYDELLDNWRDLERKAQISLGLSGILLTGVFGIVTQSLDRIFPAYALLIALTLVSLAASVMCSVKVLFTTHVQTPPSGEDLEGLAVDIKKALVSGEEKERLEGFINDQFKTWKKANKIISIKNELKALYLRQGQWSIVVALGFIITATFLLIQCD